MLVGGCATPPPHEAAPVVVKEAQRVEIPVPVKREAPADLLVPYTAPAPAILSPGAGDYCLSRAGLESIIDGFRVASERLERWRAWAR